MEKSKFGCIQLTNKDDSNTLNHIEKLIISDEKLIKSSKPDEIYRSEPIGKGIFFTSTDFIMFQVNLLKEKTPIQLKTYIELPNKEAFPIPKAVIIMLHGMGSHSTPSAFIAKEFAKVGLASVAFDYRGHGYSEGKSGNIESMDEVIQDCKEFNRLVRDYFSSNYKHNFKYFLMGISMGGFLSYFISKDSQTDYNGVIFFAPAFKTQTNSYMKGVAKVLSNVLPNGFIPKIGSESVVCKNPQFFEEKDYVHHTTSIKFKTIGELIKKEHLILKDCEDFKVPFLLISGGKDKLVKPTSHFEFFKFSKSDDKELLYYPNCWHFIYAEEEIFEIISRVIDWIGSRI